MLRLDLAAVAAYIRTADTEDLLDRATIFAPDMEPAALDLIGHELHRRGVSEDEIAAHDAHRRATALVRPDGTVARCRHCTRPAVKHDWGWHRLFGRVPIFPRIYAYCDGHGG
jgi:hypothetical protein